MLNLIKKEISLCLHPTSFIFLAFAGLVFVPNYPYEVIFFFSGLSVYFCCVTSRENGDLPFTCALPVTKRDAPIARILTAAGLQCFLLLLTGIAGALKEAVFPPELLFNGAGLSANVALVGVGGILLGVFNAIFFPLYYKKPEKIGIPFVIAAASVFVLIGASVTLRWTHPLFLNILNGGNSEHTGAKLLALAVGLCGYIALTALACRLSAKRFENVDL